jgi:hypothetical protein
LPPVYISTNNCLFRCIINHTIKDEITTIGTHKIFEPPMQLEPLIQLAARPPTKASAIVAAHVGEERWRRSRPYDDGGIAGAVRKER